MSSCGQMIDDVRLSVDGRKPIPTWATPAA